MASELVEEFVAAYHEEVHRQRRDDRRPALAEVTRRLEGLIKALIEGLPGPGGCSSA